MAESNSSGETLPLNSRRNDFLAICFAMVFPTLITLVYFQWLKDAESSFQQIAFGIGKVIQFGFPVLWIWLFYRHRLKRSKNTDEQNNHSSINDLLIAAGFGLIVSVAMFAIYFFVLADSEIANNLVVMVKEKVSGMGVNSIAKYAALGIFYALCHSFMEEYYWRWFVFDMLEKFVSTPVANVISSLGFMAHHVILLGFFFNWQWLTYPLSLCIAVGGMFWAWQYKKTGSLLAPWISHMIVDAGIFSLGYFLVKEIFG
jgi:membrane protease YdiL (CAAX protease family)